MEMVVMSYKVLYRKYRPSTFQKIIGQKTIIDTLKNSVANNSFSHAYIFTGPRGTGKTSTAKVLAKAINCTSPKDGDACGECENCINFSTSPDIIEIDAASNNGVDEIRELRNNITLAPAASKYKIYIIDEVHMLSPGAFNALLKTLEEPPAHAIFILATTEVYKVPITILSRCQRYDFKKIDKKSLTDHLKSICREEKIEIDDDALEEIYSLSEGCARDALSILDQMSKTTSHITLDEILKNYNIISNKTIQTLIDDVTKGDTNRVIETIETFENTGTNAQKIIKKIIGYLEKVAINIKLNVEKRYDFAMICSLIKSLNKCYTDARINENTFTMIKMSFLEQINAPKLSTKTSSLTEQGKIIQKVTQPQEKTENSINATEKSPKKMTLTEIRINNCFADANRDSLKKITDIWTTDDNKKICNLEASEYTPVASSDKYTIFVTEEDSLANLFNIKKDDIEKALSKKGSKLKVIAITNEEWAQQKEIFKKNKIKKIKYEYIEEPKSEDDGAEIKEQLDTLFTEKIVEIS